jgi:hypothetical protein
MNNKIDEAKFECINCGLKINTDCKAAIILAVWLVAIACGARIYLLHVILIVLLIEIIFLYEVTGVSSSSMCSLENSLNS